MIRIKIIQNLSIKNKIISIILLVTFLMISFGFAFVAIWDLNRLKSDIQSNLLLNAKLISNYCVVPLTFGDDRQATEALSKLKFIKSIEIGCLYDKQGNLFATYPDTLDENTNLTLGQQAKIILIDDYFYIQKPVVFEGEEYGTLCLKANSKQLTEVKRNFIISLSLITLILILITLVIASQLQKFISAPIITLKNHINKISKYQEYSAHINKVSNDETGNLYDGFNDLLKQIQIRSKERDLNMEKLKQSTEKLDLALSGGEIGIWEWDLKTDVTLWDERMEKMFGLEIGSFEQNYEAFKKLLHPDDIATTQNAIKKALEDIEPYNTVYRVLWKNNEVRFIKARASILKDESGKPLQMTGICFDVTEIKKAEAEISALNKDLELKVAERTKELETKYTELEKMNRVFVGRELQMVALKKEITDLKSLK